MKLDEIDLNDFGAFFIKRKKEKSVWTALYYKTNFMLKQNPNAKTSIYDEKTRSFKVKKHSPNKAWIAFFDKNGRDFISMKEFTYKEIKEMIAQDLDKLYDANEYETSLDLWKKMKEDDPKLSSFYTKKWFEQKYEFIKRQLDLLQKVSP